MTALRAILQLAAIVVLALAGLVLYDAHRALSDTAGQARYTLDNVNRLVRETAQTSANVRHATAEWETSSKQQAAYFTAVGAQTQKDLEAFHELIASTDRSINGSLLPALSDAVRRNDTEMAALERQAGESLATLQSTATQISPTLASAARASESMAKIAADPSIAATLGHLDGTAGQLELTSQHIEGAAKDIQAFVHRETSPVRGTWNLIRSFISTLAGPLAQVATAAK